MGLIEKRLIKEGKESWVPGANKDLQQVTGGAQEFVVEWEGFENDAEALKNLENQGMQRIVRGLRAVCHDDLGKEAVNEQIKSIVVQNTDDKSKNSIVLADGKATFTIALGQGSTGWFSELEIKKDLEKKL